MYQFILKLSAVEYMQVVTILGDGRLVVEFHYARNIYTIKFWVMVPQKMM